MKHRRSWVAGLLVASTWLPLQRAGLAQTAGPPSPLVPPPPAMTTPGLSPGRLVGPVVYLIVDNPRTMLQMQAEPAHWSDVCQTPCRVAVDPSQVYRVNHPRYVPSDPFSLPRSSGQVTIDAQLGSKMPNIVGKVLLPVGLGIAVVGALMFFLAPREQPSTDILQTSNSRTDYRHDGLLAMVAGGGTTIAGALLWYVNTSKVELR